MGIVRIVSFVAAAESLRAIIISQFYFHFPTSIYTRLFHANRDIDVEVACEILLQKYGQNVCNYD